jgi:hypothetical protein
MRSRRDATPRTAPSANHGRMDESGVELRGGPRSKSSALCTSLSALHPTTKCLLRSPADVSLLKLPKDVVADPRHDAVASLLASHARPLWEGGRIDAAHVALGPALAATLREALAAEQACQGLELIAEKLASEQRGLDAVNRKTQAPQNARASRLLFVAGDGSTRFYRDCEALLHRYAQRLLGCRLDVAGEAFGQALFGTPKLVRSVLVFDKKLGAKSLLALLPPG